MMPFPPPFSRLGRRPAAFTLIELLVVIVIISVIVAIALPIFSRVTEQGRVTTTTSNMRQMGVAMMSYAADHNYQLPGRPKPVPGATTPTPDKWVLALQPYYQDYHVLVSPIDPVKGVSYKVTDPTLLLTNAVNNTSYIYNGFNDIGAFADPNVVPQLNNMADTGNTILMGIPYPRANNFYMDFYEHNETDVLNRTAFSGTTSIYVFADGSVRPLQYAATVGGQAVDMTKKPPNSGLYTDWLWLFDKNNPIPGS